MFDLSALKLCLVTHPDHLSLEPHLEQLLLKAIQGGVTSVQLRCKTQQPSAVRTLAVALISLLRPLEIPLIINDDVQLAKEIDADGVHLGQSDMSPIAARQFLGTNKIIGWSIETQEQLNQANALDCINYIAASAVFPSPSKKNCKTIWGLTGLAKITQASKYPVIAIGGINLSNIQSVISHGAYGVAVISAIYNHPNPEQAAWQLIQEINKGSTHVSTC